jgi:superoxide dismutase, Cu-Zn family
MSLRKALPTAALCALTLLACGEDAGDGTTGRTDAAARDSGTASDAGRPSDAGTRIDSGTPTQNADSGRTGPIDSGTTDSGLARDSGAIDAAGGDAASSDAGRTDAGTSDGGGEAPQATIAPFGSGNTVTGTAKFSQAAGKVTVVVTLANCPNGAHPVHVHEGTSCASAEAQGPHWGPGGVRGEGIPDVTCSGQTGTVTYTNNDTTASKVWTLDGNATTDPTGHAFVVHTGTDRIGCGIIN